MDKRSNIAKEAIEQAEIALLRSDFLEDEEATIVEIRTQTQALHLQAEITSEKDDDDWEETTSKELAAQDTTMSDAMKEVDKYTLTWKNFKLWTKIALDKIRNTCVGPYE